MKSEVASPTRVPTIRVDWFLRLARQRRWFHESLFRGPAGAPKAKVRNLRDSSRIQTPEPR